MLQNAFDLISDRVYPYFWKYRHLWSKGWPESYLSEESIGQIHRRWLCEAVETLYPFDTIMEYGCGPGANLVWFARQFPWARIYGVDISRPAIEEGRRYFKDFENVSFDTNKSEEMQVDVFVTDAMLIYREHLESFAQSIRNEVTKGFVCCEWHSECDEPFAYGRHWVHNFKTLFPGCELRKLTWDDWPDDGWSTYGYIITWRK